MSHSIIFKTKIIKLSDGRLLHLDLSGCNNDKHGRHHDDWTGTIYTEEEFLKKAEEFKKGSLPAKESGGFDLKIGSRYCTFYDYGEHLLRMRKRAVTFDEFMSSKKFITFQVIESISVLDDGKTVTMSIPDFEKYFDEKKWEGMVKYRRNYRLLEGEKEVVDALDSGELLRISVI